MSKILRSTILVIVSILFSACSIRTEVFYETEMDPMINISKHHRFKIFLPNNPTIEDKNFMYKLKNKLQLNGFIVVPENSLAEFGIFFTLTEKSYSHTTTDTTYKTQTTNTYGFIGNAYVSGQSTTQVPIAKTYSYTKRYKKIYIDIVAKKKEGMGNEIVWSGFMSANLDDYDKDTFDMLNELIKLIGKNYKGDIYIEEIEKDK